MTLAELEQRVGALEETVESLKARVGLTTPTDRWWVDAAGRFADDPLFDEIIALGREYRRSQR